MLILISVKTLNLRKIIIKYTIFFNLIFFSQNLTSLGSVQNRFQGLLSLQKGLIYPIWYPSNYSSSSYNSIQGTTKFIFVTYWRRSLSNVTYVATAMFLWHLLCVLVAAVMVIRHLSCYQTITYLRTEGK